MPLNLWIPGSAVAYRCACGSEFSDKRKGQMHAIRCARRNADGIEEEVAGRRNALTSVADKEMWRWGRERMARGKVGFKRGQAA